MKPILYGENEAVFRTNGIGIAGDAISCVVNEELNGIYELSMQYPRGGVHYDEIELNRIIYAKPNAAENAQPFRIYKVTVGLNGVKSVYAQHISYDLTGVPVKPFSAQSAAAAVANLSGKAVTAHPFTFWTDKSDVGTLEIAQPVSIRAAMGDGENSILGVYGGDLAYDGFTVRLYNMRGMDRGVVIRYGKNLTDLEQEKNCAQVITGIMPYAVFDETVVLIDGEILTGSGTYPVAKIVPVDFSGEFDEAPTKAELLAAAQKYMEKQQIGVPDVNLRVSFAQLEQTEEYKNTALLERVSLGDTVTVKFERIGVDAKARCIGYQYNVLLDRYDEVTLGDAKVSLADTIIQQQGEINKVLNPSYLQASVDRATQLITGNRGGYVVLRSSTGGMAPDELLIMDTDNIETAVNVWRWNKSGLGYSETGYEGPFGTAITADGQIVADFMTTGSLSANIIKAGVISDKNSRFEIDLDAGTIEIQTAATSEAEARTVLKFTPSGGLVISGSVTATAGDIGGFKLNGGNLESEGLTLDILNHKIEFGTVGEVYDISGNLVVTSTGDIALNPDASGSVNLNGDASVSGTLALSAIDIDNTVQTLQWVDVRAADGSTVTVLGRNLG